MTKTWCVEGHHYSKTNNISENEKINPKTKNIVKILKRNCTVCGRSESQIFIKLMTEGEDFFKKGKCEKNHCPSMSSSAWCDLNSKGDILKLQDKCPNPKRNCQKIITFIPKQYMLEGNGF